MSTNRRPDLFQDSPKIGRLEESISVKLRRVGFYTSEACDVATEQMGLPREVISSLALIVANPGISQKDISRATGIDKSGLVAIIDYLEDQGWIERNRSREDRRRYELRASAAGEDRLNSLIDKVKSFEKVMLASLTKSEFATLFNLLDRMLYSCRRWGAPIIELRPARKDIDEEPEALRKAG